jgi:CheY-like chemotaxis protein
MATKILLVEDSADNLLVLAICLQIEGFTVEQAHDGLEAFQKLEDKTFDVVVSDIRMPGLSGFDLVGRILERFTGMPIVLITADPRARRMATDSQAGVSSVLIKPFPVKELVRSIREALPENNV